jgi:hypothetical protein
MLKTDLGQAARMQCGDSDRPGIALGIVLVRRRVVRQPDPRGELGLHINDSLSLQEIFAGVALSLYLDHSTVLVDQKDPVPAHYSKRTGWAKRVLNVCDHPVIHTRMGRRWRR